MCAQSRAVVVLPFVPVMVMIGMRDWRAGREEHVDDGFADGARLAFRRREVHAEAGRGVDFDDAAAVLRDRRLDVGRDDVDAGDVEADQLARSARPARCSPGCTRSVTSIDVPPVERFAVVFSGTIWPRLGNAVDGHAAHAPAAAPWRRRA